MPPFEGVRETCGLRVAYAFSHLIHAQLGVEEELVGRGRASFVYQTAKAGAFLIEETVQVSRRSGENTSNGFHRWHLR